MYSGIFKAKNTHYSPVIEIRSFSFLLRFSFESKKMILEALVEAGFKSVFEGFNVF